MKQTTNRIAAFTIYMNKIKNKGRIGTFMFTWTNIFLASTNWNYGCECALCIHKFKLNKKMVEFTQHITSNVIHVDQCIIHHRVTQWILSSNTMHNAVFPSNQLLLLNWWISWNCTHSSGMKKYNSLSEQKSLLLLYSTIIEPSHMAIVHDASNKCVQEEYLNEWIHTIYSFT